MKWVGQHIWDFISRFRSDVYLEEIESGTIAAGGNLGLDSDNKVVKASASGVTLNGNTSNGICTYGGVDTIDVESSLTWNSSTLGASGNFTLDVGNLLTIDSDSGTISFQDAGSQLATINNDGLSFVDNTGAGIKFEGATDNGYQTFLNVVDPTATRTISLPDAAGTVALTSDIPAVKETFHFNKRITTSGTSTTTWYGGYPANSYISSVLYDLSTAKSGDNYTDTTGRGWSTNRFTNWMVASDATVKKFRLCGVEQSGVSTNITVAIWKVSPTINQANQSSDVAVVDFIGEIELTADADTQVIQAPPAELTSFQSGASLSAGDGIMLAARRTGGGTDGTFWYVRGVVEIEYD
jgi:hypothetical protein